MLEPASILIFLSSVFAYVQEGDFDKSVRTYRENKLDSAMHHIDKAIDLYKDLGNNDSLVFAFAHKALILVSKSGLADAQQLMDDAMEVVDRLPHKSVAKVAAYTRIGQLSVQMYDLASAAHYFGKAEEAMDNKQSANRHYVILNHSLAQLYLSKQQYGLADNYAKKAYEINLEVEGKEGALMANIWQTRYFISFYEGDYDQALKDGLEFQQAIQRHYHANHPNTGMMHNSLSDIYHVLNLPENALYHQHKAVDIHYHNYLETGNGYTLAGAYSNLGGLYYGLHEYYLANEYLTKAKDMLENSYGEFGPGLLETLVMMGNTKQELGMVEEAEKLFEQAYRLQQKYVPDELSKQAYIESYYGDFEFSRHRFPEAIAYYDKAIQHYAKIGDGNSYYSLYAKADKGIALGYSNRWDESINIQREAITEFRKYFPQSKSNALSFLDNISMTHRQAGRLEEALSYSDSVFLNSLKMEQLPKNPLDWISQLPYNFNSCKFLLNRVSILWDLYHQIGQKHYLYELLGILDGYGVFLSNNLYTFRTQASLIEQAQLNKKIYAIGITTCWELSGRGKDVVYLERALGYAERSKALLLRLASNNLMVDASRDAGDGIAKRDHDFRKQINSFNEQYLNATHESDSVLRLLTIAMEDYRRFQDSLKKSGHESFLAKYDLSPYGIAEIRAKLIRKGETLIQYAVTDEAVYAFVVTANEFHVHCVGKEALDDIKVLRDLHVLSAQRFVESAYRLYQTLIAPLLPYFDSKRLFIIPDADLYYLNFELLLQHANEMDFARMPYFIKDYSISYLLSASSAIRFKESHLRLARKKAMLFVPVFTQEMKDDFLNGLPEYAEVDNQYYFLNRQPFSLLAARQIARHISHDLYTEYQAQERIFKRSAQNYRVLHFGTHAEVNDASPLQSRLFFAKAMAGDTSNTDDGYLHAYEIYSMQLRAELAVLTACETGSGMIRQGEGMMSLAHSFLHAGCSSVVMSLWKIDEKTNADIIAKFYEYLAKGADKREALRKAKLHFLKTNDGELSHPYYWAGLSLIGDVGTVYPSYTWVYWCLGGVFGLALIALGLRRGRKI